MSTHFNKKGPTKMTILKSFTYQVQQQSALILLIPKLNVSLVYPLSANFSTANLADHGLFEGSPLGYPHRWRQFYFHWTICLWLHPDLVRLQAVHIDYYPRHILHYFLFHIYRSNMILDSVKSNFPVKLEHCHKKFAHILSQGHQDSISIDRFIQHMEK